MPTKTKKESVRKVEESESDSSDSSSGPAQGQVQEVNRANILNYQSDSSDYDQEDDERDYEPIANNVEAFNRQMRAGRSKEIQDTSNVWGNKKKSFYADQDQEQSGSGDSSEAEIDQEQEAERLAKIRLQKIQRQMAQRQQLEEEQARDEGEASDEAMEESDNNLDDIKGTVKLGNKLFDDSESDSDAEQQNVHKKIMKLMDDPELARSILLQDSPELPQLLKELSDALDQQSSLSSHLKLASSLNSQQKTYVEMKSTLLSSYSTFLSFFLLMKAEGRDCTDHAVLSRLTNLKDLLSQLAPLDQILSKFIGKQKRKVEEVSSQAEDEEEEAEEEADESGEFDQGDDYSSAEPNKAKEYGSEGSEGYGEEDDYDSEDLEKEVLRNQKKLQNKPEKLLTKKELKAQQKQKSTDLMDQLAGLDDEQAAINAVAKSKKKEKPQSKVADEKKEIELADLPAEVYDDPKDKKKPIKFSDLKLDQAFSKKQKGDKVIRQEKQRLRDKKASRKIRQEDSKAEALQNMQAANDKIMRNVNHEIEKSKGITRKRKIEDKNPRIRRRRQFDRLEKKHKTMVQQVKEGPQPLYAGETQGIRAGVKKSTKLS